MSDVNLATKSDLTSLFKELEDAAKHAKIENTENKIKTEPQVKEPDSFITPVQEVAPVQEVTTKSDLASLFQELEDAAKHAKKVINETPKKEPKVIEVADIVVEEPVIKSPVVETKSLSIEDENKLGAFAGLMSSFGAILDAPPEVEDTDALKLQVEDTPKVVTQEEEDNKLEALQNLFSSLVEAPRIPRKKGQPAGSDKHSDLYTDENPKGTIQGLGFKDVATAKASVSKIEGSSKTHAHKIQAAVAMEQRAKEMGKTAEAAIYRSYIEKMKKKTKEMQKEEVVTPEITEVTQKTLPTKEKTVEATQELITNVIANLDDMKSKTEVEEQLSEIGIIRKEFDNFRSLVSQQIASTKMSGAGSGEVRLEFLDDVSTTGQEDGDVLTYNSSTSKYELKSTTSTVGAGQLLEETDGSNIVFSGTDASGSDEGDDVLLESGVSGSRDIDQNVLQVLTTDIIPQQGGKFNLGSETHRFKNIFLEANTIDLDGATISSDGSGQITISADGATLPAGSKDTDGKELVTAVAQTSTSSVLTAQPTKSVSLFTQSSGLTTAAATFTFAKTLSRRSVYTNSGHTFLLSSGESRTDASVELFEF
jgi:hypothetical protein